HRIQQVVLKNLPVDMFFEKTPRVDRCVTCHQAIDNPDPQYRAGAAPQLHPVLRSHPRPDLFVAANSKHPYGTFGCTICHLGRPMGVSFSRAAHSPQRPQQALEWQRAYAWAPCESWEQKMLPLQYTEASCLKCHHGLDEIPAAARLNEGRELFRNRGCTNCHVGLYGDKDLAWVGRTGPDLRRIGEKLSLQWSIGWTLNPSNFRPGTTMPRFLGLENRRDDNGEALKLQLSSGAVDRDAVETEAINTYLFVTSKLREKALPEPPPGDAAAGRSLFAAVGCVACHATRDRAGADRFTLSAFAPDLSRIGDKVSPRWLFAWLKGPWHYWLETKMPDLRLSDTEAAAIAGYLVQTMRSGVQPVAYQAFPEECFDALIIDKLSTTVPRERLAALLQDTVGLLDFSAATKVKHPLPYPLPQGERENNNAGEWTAAQFVKIKELLSAEPNQARAVKAFCAGEFLIQHHGCYGCHNIQGFACAPLPCPSLEGEADKDLAQFAFGKTLAGGASAHTKWDWIRTKISRPRAFDLGRLDLIRPFERLHMPWFELTPSQVDALVTHVLSLILEPIPAEMQHQPTNREIALDRGHRVFRELNCASCHLAGLSSAAVGQAESLSYGSRRKAIDENVYAGEDLVSLSYAAKQPAGAPGEPAVLPDMLNIKRGTCLTRTTIPILLAEMPARAAPMKVRFTKGEGAIVPHIVKLEGERGVRNAGPQQAPPSLVFEGCRVQPDWLYQYLRHVHTLRWGFTIRMPSFWGAPEGKVVYPTGRLSALKDTFKPETSLAAEPSPPPEAPRASELPDDAAQLVEFLACDAGEKPFGYQPQPLATAEDRLLYEQGRRVVTGSELGCTNCHTLGERNPPEPKWAFNLANVKRRLKEPWLNRFLINPQSIYPWTNMPNNFKIDWEGSYKDDRSDPLRGLMDGDEAKMKEAAEKIRAVKCYLLHLGEGEIGK
ncbi:MAG: c-type cytochrome, partial [Planctomycetota bacterium]